MKADVTGCSIWTCREDWGVGGVYHYLGSAMMRARRMNLRAGRKIKKVVVRDHHFRVVDV